MQVKKQQLENRTIDWFKIRKRLQKGCILSPCLLTYAEYIMQNTRLTDSQPRINTARRNINNFRYAGDTTLKAESEATKVKRK